MKVVPVQRKSAVLTPSTLACLSKVATVNLTCGCAHGCVYCYTRGYRMYPGEDTVWLYANMAAKLRDELDRRRSLPAVVYFSPSSDLFQPVAEVLDLTYEVLEILFQRKIGVAFLTKGEIPRRHMELLTAHARLVQAQIGLITLDDDVRAACEPGSAPPSVRLAQAAELVAAGVPTRGRLDPILPGVTDDDETFRSLCSALGQAGITAVAASLLFLRPAVSQSLKKHLGDGQMLKRLLDAFASRTRLSIHAENSSITALPADTRREILGRLRAAAGSCGIEVHVCACKNPDIADGDCQIAGRWPAGAGRSGTCPPLRASEG